MAGRVGGNGAGNGVGIPLGATSAPETSLRDIWSTALARWPWALGVCVCTLAAVAVYVFREQPIYAAKLTVRIDRTPNPIPDAQAFAPTYDYRVDPLASEQQVIKSLTIATRTALALGLPAHLSLIDAARDFQTRILTRVLPETDIIEVTVLGPDSAWDRQAGDTLTRVYADYSREQAQIRAHQRSQYIAQSLTDQATALAQSQDSLRAFQTAHQAPDVNNEELELFKQIYKFSADREQLTLEQQVYAALVGQLDRGDTADNQLRWLAATDAVTHNPSVTGLYTSWVDLERTRQRLLFTRTEHNADVQALDSAIASTKRNLRQASAFYLATLNARMASLDSADAQLRRQTDRFPPMVSEQARRAAIVKTRQAEYDALLSQYQIARISEGGETGGVRVLDAATVLPIPVAPNRPRDLLVALILGLVLGAGAASMVDRLDDSVRTVAELRDRFQLPVLAMIPQAPGGSAGLVTHLDPQSPVAEAFRSLRTSVSFARAHGEPRTIVITSAGPGEGKSTVAANLAITFAQQGRRALVIDADLRRAAIDRLFDVPSTPGLSDLLVGRGRLPEVARAAAVPNLSVVACGPVPPNPAELLASTAMREVLEEARTTFDVVIVDSPPLLAVTDPAVVASLVDGVILVVRLGTTARDAIQRSVAQLASVDARLLGVVPNGVARRTAGYGAYASYYKSTRSVTRTMRTGLPA